MSEQNCLHSSYRRTNGTKKNRLDVTLFLVEKGIQRPVRFWGSGSRPLEKWRK